MSKRSLVSSHQCLDSWLRPGPLPGQVVSITPDFKILKANTSSVHSLAWQVSSPLPALLHLGLPVLHCAPWRSNGDKPRRKRMDHWSSSPSILTRVFSSHGEGLVCIALRGDQTRGSPRQSWICSEHLWGHKLARSRYRLLGVRVASGHPLVHAWRPRLPSPDTGGDRERKRCLQYCASPPARCEALSPFDRSNCDTALLP